MLASHVGSARGRFAGKPSARRRGKGLVLPRVWLYFFPRAHSRDDSRDERAATKKGELDGRTPIQSQNDSLAGRGELGKCARVD